MDRRVDSRLEVRLPCYVSERDGKAKSFVGVTENMSRNGMLVLWNTGGPNRPLPKSGETFTLEIELPANHPFGRKCMRCQVAVVRVSKSTTSFPRVAFQITQMQFGSLAKEKMSYRAGGRNHPAVQSVM